MLQHERHNNSANQQTNKHCVRERAAFIPRVRPGERRETDEFTAECDDTDYHWRDREKGREADRPESYILHLLYFLLFVIILYF